MTRWLGELAGFRTASFALKEPTVSSALASLVDALDPHARAQLVRDGHLHPSVIVVVEGSVCADHANTALSDGQTVQLMLPTAGG